MRTSLLGAIVATGAALAAASPALASQSFLFSQTGTAATVTPLPGRRADVVLRTGHRDVVAFEQRPGRRTATLREDAFTGLWRGTFRTDAPNAVITGRSASGVDSRAVVRIDGASRVADGVRYRVRVLRGSLATSLSPANVVIDSVSPSSITLVRIPQVRGIRITPPNITSPALPQPLAVHFNFPHFSPPVLNIAPSAGLTAGNPLVLHVAGGAVTQGYSALTFYYGSQVVVNGNPGAVTMSFAPGASGCALPEPLTWSIQLTASNGSVGNYGPGDPLGSATFTQSVVGGTCFLRWSNLVTPAPQGGVTFALALNLTYVENPNSTDFLDAPTLQSVRFTAI